MTPSGGTSCLSAFVGSCGLTTHEGIIMTYEISALIAQSHDTAEVLAGAYGYLSAALDEYLHSDNVAQDTLHADFHRLQHEVTEGLQRIFAEKGITMADTALGVRQAGWALDLPAEEVSKAVRRALKMVYPATPVIEP